MALKLLALIFLVFALIVLATVYLVDWEWDRGDCRYAYYKPAGDQQLICSYRGDFKVYQTNGGDIPYEKDVKVRER